MSTLGPLVEYLLAVRDKAGGQICRMGVTLATVPVFPPGLALTYLSYPPGNSFAGIEFWHDFSPAMVPDVFSVAVSQQGLTMTSGTISETGTQHPGHNLWIVYTEGDPIRTVITNISGVDQFFEVEYLTLIVDSEAYYKMVLDIVRHWGTASPLLEGVM